MTKGRWFKVKQYSIGEVAKKLGVTSSFLKYYEQHGVLDPHVAPNGYRSYEGRHISAIQECIKLRNLGYSARQTQQLLNSPYADSLESFAEKREEIERQICFLQYAAEYMDMAREEHRFFVEEPCWTVDEHGDFYFLAQSRDGRFVDDEATRELSLLWNQWIPAVRVTACVDRRVSTFPKIVWGLAMPMAFAKAMKLSYGAPVEYVPAMRCLEVFDRRPIGDKLNEKGIDYVRDSMLAHVDSVLAQHGFTPVGPSYFFVRAKLREDGERCTYQKILTPVL